MLLYVNLDAQFLSEVLLQMKDWIMDKLKSTTATGQRLN